MNYPHIAARALNRPLLIEPGYARQFFAALGPRLNIAQLQDASGVTLDRNAQVALATSYLPRAIDPWTGADKTDQSYPVVNGIAVIAITGTLMHNGGYIGSSSGSMCYDGIHAQILSAQTNSAVKGILLKFDTPGGEVSGCQALGDVIANCSKPVWGHANDQAASAGCWLISQCDKVFISTTAEIGSIGVVMAHGDYSQALANEGIKVTLIYSGAHKVDGNPYQGLPEPVAAAMQADLDDLRTLFAATVAKGRGNQTAQVLSTEALMYRGHLAVDIGLADEVMSFDDTLATFSATFARSGVSTKGKTMSKPDNTAAANSGEGTTAASAEQLATAHAAGVAEGTAAGAVAERTRIGAILNHENAQGREATAREFALGTDMTADTAIKVLASVPATNNKAATALAQMGDTQVIRAESEGSGKVNGLIAQYAPNKG